MVGSPQDIKCSVSNINGMESSSVIIGWMGPKGDCITNDNRVTISPITTINNVYISSLKFDYLQEGDEGKYTCNVQMPGINLSQPIELQSLTSK